jgi:polar amino acid transport system substrate-binding protein
MTIPRFAKYLMIPVLAVALVACANPTPTATPPRPTNTAVPATATSVPATATTAATAAATVAATTAAPTTPAATTTVATTAATTAPTTEPTKAAAAATTEPTKAEPTKAAATAEATKVEPTKEPTKAAAAATTEPTKAEPTKAAATAEATKVEPTKEPTKAAAAATTEPTKTEPTTAAATVAATVAPTTAAAATVAATTAATSAPKACAANNVLKVASDASYPPFENVNDKKDIVGFDVELLTAIAKSQGLDVTFTNENFSTIFAKLAQGDYDAVISAATITEERAKTVDFSNPYFISSQSITVRKADISKYKTLDDLAGLKVGVQKGTTGEELVTGKVKNATASGYELAPQALQALANKDVDAVVIDTPVALNIIAEQPQLGLAVVAKDLTTENYGIAVRKDCASVLNKINAGLRAVVADGTYNTIYKKYFGEDAPAEFKAGASSVATVAATAAATTAPAATATTAATKAATVAATTVPIMAATATP